MIRPNKITVCGVLWNIEYCGKEAFGKMGFPDSGGLTVYGENKIYILETLTEPAQRETLLHEVIHAIEDHLDVGMKEKQVKVFSAGLFEFMRHNPKAIGYLMEPDEETR